VGAPARDRPPEQFVVCSQNHDQVGNRAFGDRLPRRVRPLAAFCTLLSPFTPMLFMGEEWGENAPFQFFTDHIDKRIARATRDGRRKEFADFAAFAGEEVPDPQSPETFERSKLTRREDRRVAALYSDLLRLRSDLGRVEAEVVALDEARRWLRVRRGPFELVMNFASRRREIQTSQTRVLLSTHDVSLDGDSLTLPPLSGALLR
jgi:maltooligosyltrehalose trehalohydrolase